jgi:NAD(P)-dependent dehydrogenase (short-subunit alcohol dehydrogenase family)
VNAVLPGFVQTPMAQRAIDGNLFHAPPEQILASYPILRIGPPEEVAWRSPCSPRMTTDTSRIGPSA